MLRPVFFRNKGAYIVGRIRRGERSLPLLLALANRSGRVVVDAVLSDEDEASIVFSFTRSYFHVDVENAAALVAFLKTVMPKKPVSELYTALGFNKHGKTELFRDLLRHMAASDDAFVLAPGEPGMVMIVFTLPSYDVVFKVIRDVFAYPKTTDRKEVLGKYRMVFEHGRAGRLVDVQEFEHLEFPVSRLSPPLLETLLTRAPSTVELAGDNVVIHHLFTERRLTPLDLFLKEAPPEAIRRAILDYGEAIRDMAKTNIFPGDLLLKNFGLTRHGRVVFYDYDEIAFVSDINFRELPDSGDGEGEGGEEPSFYVGENDVFPEELFTFMGLRGAAREAFLEAHGDLLGVGFWLEMQSGSGRATSSTSSRTRRAAASRTRPGTTDSNASLCNGPDAPKIRRPRRFTHGQRETESPRRGRQDHDFRRKAPGPRQPDHPVHRGRRHRAATSGAPPCAYSTPPSRRPTAGRRRSTGWRSWPGRSRSTPSRRGFPTRRPRRSATTSSASRGRSRRRSAAASGR